MSSHPDISTLTPSELILERTRAFARADFGFIYDSFHSESNIRAQFGERDDYVRFGWASLGKDFTIRRCEVVRERVAVEEAQVIFYLEMETPAARVAYAELAWLQREGGGWRYHRGQKMEEELLPADPMTLDFADFEKLDPRIVF